MSRLDDMVAARRRSEALATLRTLAQRANPPRPPGPTALQEWCDICRAPIPDDHRHLLHLEERRIVCSCEACWALYSGNPEYRPTGMRTLWLSQFECDAATWSAFQIPIGLAFFMRSSVTAGIVAFYPSPAGATESELSLDAWAALVQRNPILEELDTDAEALVVSRLSEPHQYVIAPIDACYALVGLIKSRWEGISGGDAIERAVPEFFAALRARARMPVR
jgi:hypothetical protein